LRRRSCEKGRVRGQSAFVGPPRHQSLRESPIVRKRCNGGTDRAQFGRPVGSDCEFRIRSKRQVMGFACWRRAKTRRRSAIRRNSNGIELQPRPLLGGVRRLGHLGERSSISRSQPRIIPNPFPGIQAELFRSPSIPTAASSSPAVKTARSGCGTPRTRGRRR
jgi:hypothetical protein